MLTDISGLFHGIIPCGPLKKTTSRLATRMWEAIFRIFFGHPVMIFPTGGCLTRSVAVNGPWIDLLR